MADCSINTQYLIINKIYMTQLKLKRVYEEPEKSDGYRIFIDRLWPRGIRKELFHYDLWEKDIAPSPRLRSMFHKDKLGHWEMFKSEYREELNKNTKTKEIIEAIRREPIVTLLYASKDPIYNHALVLKRYLETQLEK